MRELRDAMGNKMKIHCVEKECSPHSRAPPAEGAKEPRSQEAREPGSQGAARGQNDIIVGDKNEEPRTRNF